MWKFSRRCTIMFRTGPLGEKARKGEVFMRKIIAILLTVSLLVLMLCACGGRSSHKDGETKEPAASASATASAKPTATPKSAESAKPDAGQKSTAPAGIVDGVKYNKVDLGMSYDEVKDIMGSAGTQISTSDIGGMSMATYQWLTADETGTCAVAFKNGKVSTKMQMNVARTDPVATKAKFDKVKEGMTYKEVREIFGAEGVVTYMDADEDFGYEYVEYMWNGPDDSFAQVVFDGGKVSLSSEKGLS